ncbi:hypothetical protein SDC9_210212 [bioreactor metagenome]|uniref:Uncharacterized protein n=1 Tax=bioreactor metagenome TaxID=1076179 RepID=A0A645JSZ4_9ZZZZ
MAHRILCDHSGAAGTDQTVDPVAHLRIQVIGSSRQDDDGHLFCPCLFDILLSPFSHQLKIAAILCFGKTNGIFDFSFR